MIIILLNVLPHFYNSYEEKLKKYGFCEKMHVLVIRGENCHREMVDVKNRLQSKGITGGNCGNVDKREGKK